MHNAEGGLPGKSVDELKEACNAKPECKGFNSAGWLKSAIAPEEEWYAWDEGSLFVKKLPPMLLQTKEPVEGEPDAEFSTGQGESGHAFSAVCMGSAAILPVHYSVLRSIETKITQYV